MEKFPKIRYLSYVRRGIAQNINTYLLQLKFFNLQNPYFYNVLEIAMQDPV